MNMTFEQLVDHYDNYVVKYHKGGYKAQRKRNRRGYKAFGARPYCREGVRPRLRRAAHSPPYTAHYFGRTGR